MARGRRAGRGVRPRERGHRRRPARPLAQSDVPRRRCADRRPQLPLCGGRAGRDSAGSGRPPGPRASPGRYRHRPGRGAPPGPARRPLRADRAANPRASRAAAPARVRPRARPRRDAPAGAAPEEAERAAGGLDRARRRTSRGPAPRTAMIPLIVFVLGCAAVYLGAIEAAFSALMRLSLRLVAERSDRPGALGEYLDEPLLLLVPLRFLLGLVTATATALTAVGIGIDG